jgi:hypothetical protein
MVVVHGGIIVDALPHGLNHSWFPLIIHMGGMSNGIKTSSIVVTIWSTIKKRTHEDMRNWCNVAYATCHLPLEKIQHYVW